MSPYQRAYRSLYRTVVQHPALKSTAKKILYVVRHAVMLFIRLIRPIDPNKVVFSSFQGTAYNDNPRYISEMLHAMAPELKIVWLIRKGRIHAVQLPDYVRRAKYNRLDAILELATARVWVDNVMKSQSFIFRRDKQIYFNTWHGDRGFKKVGRDNEGKSFEPRLERFCDAMIAGSEFGAHTYRTAFDYQGEVLMDGCPRNDILVKNDPEVAAALRSRMGFEQDVKLLLYAPTFRDNISMQNQHAELDLPGTLDILERVTGERWIGLLRTHYLSHGIDLQDQDRRIVNVTAWPEMAELLAVSDMVISDYSSCTGDFILRDKPAVLYQADVEQYNDNRSFYFDMRTSPFWIAHDMNELREIIEGMTEERIKENCHRWREFFGVTETGHATEASVRFILERMKNKQ